MKRLHALIGAVVTVLLLVTGLAYAQGTAPERETRIEAAGGTAFTYQGHLSDENGPVNGTCDLTFELYDAAGSGTPPTGGTLLATVEKPAYPIADGLFTAELDFGSAVFDGDARWLQVAVDCGDGAVTLSPRQALTPAPYALHADLLDGQHASAFATTSHDHLGETWSGSDNSLVITGTFGSPDHATLVLGNADGHGLKVDSAGWDGVLVGSAGGAGVSVGSAALYGVSVNSAGWDGVNISSASWDGVNISSAGGTGVAVGSAGETGVAVGSAGWDGVNIGSAGETGVAVDSAVDEGVYVVSAGGDGFKVCTTGDRTSCAVAYGHHGLEVGNAQHDGVHVINAGVDGFEVHDAAEVGVRVVHSGSAGVRVESADSHGVYANTNATYGFYTPDDIYSGGGSDIAEHIDTTGDLEPSDVVVIDPEHNEQVVKSTTPYDSAVAGIISSDPAMVIGKSDTETPLALAGRVLCKVSAENGPIHRGDLLTTSSTPGHAMKATDPRPGTILGKAMGELESGTGVITVLVTLQ